MNLINEEQKWDGFASPITDYVMFSFNTLQYLKEITDVRLEIYRTMCCTCDFFEILYWEGINSLPKFEASEGIKNVFRIIRRKANPELEDTLDWTNVNHETEIFLDLMPPPGL